MKTNRAFLLLCLFSMLVLLVNVQCAAKTASSGGGGGSVYDTFCAHVMDCSLGNLIGATTTAQCLDYAKGVSGTLGACVVQATNCTEVNACFGATDDDDNDDNDDNDDTSPSDTHVEITKWALYIGAPDYPSIMSPATSIPGIGIHEAAVLALDAASPDCALGGGELHYILDGGADTVVGTIPAGTLHSITDDQLIGYDFSKMTGAMADGHHNFDFYITNKCGAKSATHAYSYDVGDYATSIGHVMADFTENDENGDPVSLSDSAFTGNIVVVDGFAEWCGPCKQEATDDGTLMQTYKTAGDPVAMVGLMNQNGNYGSNIAQTDLQNWVNNHGWTGLIPCLDDGDRPPSHPSVQQPYWLMPAYPFNMILDKNHVIRLKWHGYGPGMIGDAVTWLMNQD